MPTESVGILLAVLVLVLLVIQRLGPAIVDSAALAFSGEQGSLMPRGMLGHSARIRRMIELQAVVSRLALVTRLNLPLEPALDAASRGERGRLQRILRRITLHIHDGHPVSAALGVGFPGCPPQLFAALKRAEACGQLPEALHQQEHMIGSVIDDQFRFTAHMRHAVGYALFMTLFCAGLICWVLIFLIPKYKDIFLDFDTKLPSVTIALLGISDWFFVHWLAVLTLLGLLCGILGILLVAGSSEKTTLSAGIIARLRRSVPLIHGLDHGWGMAKTIRSLALDIRSGAPLFSQDLSLVVAPTNPLRTRIQEFSGSVIRGVIPHTAARDAGLGDVFVCALRMVEHGEDPERILAHAANYYESLAYRWWHALAALSGPLVTLAAGTMVCFVALALFMPLVALIDAVSGTLP